MAGLTHVCQDGAIARHSVQRRVFQLGAVLLQKGFCFIGAILSKSLMDNKWSGRIGVAKELGRTLVGGNHALLNQVLG